MKIAVILPCHNEETAIVGTINDFKKYLPDAEIWVCDNNSTDRTSDVAKDAGARVLKQPLIGKGNAVRRLITQVDADVYIMADGDGTYDAAAAPEMVERLISDRLDMVIGQRKGTQSGQYRMGHQTANQLYSKVFSKLFRTNISDLLSGYRVMSRRFVKTFPCVAKGFEIETELNAHSAVYRLPVVEIETRYHARAEGSNSKLRKFRDGSRILWYFLVFLRDYAPFRVFSYVGLILLLPALISFIDVLLEYFKTQQVPRLPTLQTSLTFLVLSAISVITGFVAQSISAARYHNFMIAYNRYSALEEDSE